MKVVNILLLLTALLSISSFATAALTKELWVLEYAAQGYENPAQVNTKVTALMSTCQQTTVVAKGQGSPWKLTAGAWPGELRFAIQTDDNAFANHVCGKEMKKLFPTLQKYPVQWDVVVSPQCYTQSQGFVTGYEGCLDMAGAACLSSVTCGSGTECLTVSSRKRCTIVNKFHKFSYTFDTNPTSIEEAKDMLTTVDTLWKQNAANAGCAKTNTGDNNLSISEYFGSEKGNVIDVYVADLGKINATCLSFLQSTTLPTPPVDPEDPEEPEDPENPTNSTDAFFMTLATPTLTKIDYTSTTITDANCYTTTSAGFTRTLTPGGNIQGVCMYGTPYGSSCTSVNSCSANAQCTSGTCIYASLDDIKAANTFYRFTLTFATQQKSPALKARVQPLIDAEPKCVAFTDAVSKGSVTAVAGSLTKFNLYMYLPSTTVEQDSLDALNGLEAFSGFTDLEATVVDLTALACVITASGSSSSIVALSPGGKCRFGLDTARSAIGESCNSNSDCDASTLTTCSVGKCSRDDVDEDDANMFTARRIDVDANAYLGTELGKLRLEEYLKKLAALDGCGFTHSAISIGNPTYTRAYLYVGPFNYRTCGLEKVQAALHNANMVELEKEFTILQAEGGSETPVAVVPKLTYAQTKSFTYTIPLECKSGSGEIECYSHDPSCAIPCPAGTSCTGLISGQCGAGKCGTAGYCEQTGEIPSGYIPQNDATRHIISSSSLLVAIMVTILATFFF